MSESDDDKHVAECTIQSRECAECVRILMKAFDLVYDENGIAVPASELEQERIQP